jgi:hypothetical protein
VLVADVGGGTMHLALVRLAPQGVVSGQATVLAKQGRPVGGQCRRRLGAARSLRSDGLRPHGGRRRGHPHLAAADARRSLPGEGGRVLRGRGGVPDEPRERDLRGALAAGQPNRGAPPGPSPQDPAVGRPWIGRGRPRRPPGARGEPGGRRPQRAGDLDPGAGAAVGDHEGHPPPGPARAPRPNGLRLPGGPRPRRRTDWGRLGSAAAVLPLAKRPRASRTTRTSSWPRGRPLPRSSPASRVPRRVNSRWPWPRRVSCP